MADFDVIVIGGGSAGFAAAGRAVENGAKVALIESDKLGGDCPNRACVPTKVLLRAAKLYELMQNAEVYGIKAEKISFDWHKIVARKNAVVDQLTGERLKRILDKRGISLFTGHAAFKSAMELELDGKTISAARFIIATGSVPYRPPIKGLDEVGYLTNNEAVNLTELPGSMAFIGGGPVGIEFAQIFNCFGVAVTILETSRRLLPREDAEITELLRTYVKERGIEVITEAEVVGVVARSGQKVVEVKAPSGRKELVVDEMMIATGRAPAVEDLNLSAAGVRYDSHGVEVDDSLKTSADNIWACGDVTGKFLYTHVATYQGDLAGYNATAPRPDHADYNAVPRVTFSDPEVAGVGLTEAQAKEAGHDVKIGRMPLRYLGKALITGERRGLVKLIVDGPTRRVLGGEIIGAQAGELIHEIALAVRTGAAVDVLAELIHAYPTLAEGIEAAAADVSAAEGPAHEERAA